MSSILIAIVSVLTVAPAVNVTLIAYVDGGEVWLPSLDGTQKVRLATPGVNGEEATEKWLPAAASDQRPDRRRAQRAFDPRGNVLVAWIAGASNSIKDLS